jgi:TorA maturation chaperone TorD
MEISVSRDRKNDAATNAESMAQIYSMLASILNQKPEVSLIENLRSAGSTGLAGLTPLDKVQSQEDIEQGIQKLACYIETTALQTLEDVQRELAVDWTLLFRGVSPAYGPQPPYEGMFLPEQGDHLEVMQAVSDTYRDMGVETINESFNRPDYLGIELAVMGFFAQEEAKAYNNGATQDALNISTKAKHFMIEHIGQWAPKFIEEADLHAKTEFYKGVLQLIRGVISIDAIERKSGGDRG